MSNNGIIKVGGARSGRQALEEGYDAHQEGLTLNDCPYKWGNGNGAYAPYWTRGWYMSQRGEDLPAASDD